jgi:sugar phosphate isomerase/epimerase
MFQSLDPRAIGLALPFEEALRLAAAHGFAGLEVPLDEVLGRAQANSVQQVTEQFQVCGVHPGGWWVPVHVRESEEHYLRELAQLPAYAQLAQALQSPWGWTVVLPFSDPLSSEANMELHVQRLRPVAQILADYGCRLGLEFIGTLEQRAWAKAAFIYTIDGALELAARLGTGNTGLLLDCFQWYTSGATRADLAHLSADHIVSVQVSDARSDRTVDEQIDNQRLLPGASGVIDSVGFLQALAGMGYRGPIVAEPFNAPELCLPAEERVRAVKHSLERIWSLAGLAVG